MSLSRTSLVLTLLVLPRVASAAPLAWVSSKGESDDPVLKATQTCPTGQTVVGGGVLTQGVYMANRSLQASGPAGTDAWRTVTETVEGADTEVRDFEVAALCASPDVSACIERVEAEWSPDVTPTKTVAAECPDGTLAIAGGAEITGSTYGRGFRRLGPGGLFFPTSWVAQVDVYAADSSFGSDWGVKVYAWCAPASAVAPHVTLLGATWGDGGCFDSDCMIPGFDYAADTTYRFGDPNWPELAQCAEPLSVGMSGDDGRFIVEAGPAVSNGHASAYEGKIGTFTKGVWNTGVAECADDLNGFADDVAAACAVPEPEPEPDPYRVDLSRWRIGGVILYGLIGGGNGVIWLPGVGPIPVDPEPIQSISDALPVMVAGYDDPRRLADTLDEVTRGLSEEGVRYVESASVEDALRGEELLIVVPDDEAGAVAWLSEHRERLAGRAMPVIVMLDRAGRGFTALERW